MCHRLLRRRGLGRYGPCSSMMPPGTRRCLGAIRVRPPLSCQCRAHLPQLLHGCCAIVCRTQSRAIAVSTRARSSREKQTSPPSLATATTRSSVRRFEGSYRKVGEPESPKQTTPGTDQLAHSGATTRANAEILILRQPSRSERGCGPPPGIESRSPYPGRTMSHPVTPDASSVSGRASLAGVM